MTELTTKLQLEEESNHFHTTVPWTAASLISIEKGGRGRLDPRGRRACWTGGRRRGISHDIPSELLLLASTTGRTNANLYYKDSETGLPYCDRVEGHDCPVF